MPEKNRSGVVLLFFNLAGAAVGIFFSLLGSVSYAPSLALCAVLLRGGVVCRSQVACDNSNTAALRDPWRRSTKKNHVGATVCPTVAQR